ncbi:ATP-binding protein, partial [Streptomyces sp. SID7958]|nr:ATP-binding protein [Streptomyces sp. SID7958]
GAPEAARRLLTRALQEPPLPEERAALLHELACSTFLIKPTATVAHLREALTEPGVEPELRASIVYRLTQALAHTDRMAEAATVAGDEARRARHPRIRLRMQADAFVWSAFRTDEPDSAARSRRLARLAARVAGRGLEERYILGLRAWDAVLCGEPRETALGHAEEALRGGLSWTDQNRGFEVPVSVALVFMYCDQPRRAEELFARGMAECEDKGWRGSHLALGQALAGYIRHQRGCLAEAENLVREGLRIADRVEGAVPAQWFAVGILIQTLLARGRTAAARRLADRYRFGKLVPNAVIYPDPRTVYAELLLAEGRHADAAALLSEVGEWLDRRDWRNPAWCPWQSGLASALARTAPDVAVRHAREAVKRARDFGAASAIGRAVRTLAEVTGGPAAIDLYAEAVDHLERSPAAYELARALVGHGAALSRNGRLQEAADRLYQGLEGAVHCGAEALAVRARDELAAAGLRPLPLRYGQTDTLTAPERKAAELAARGVPAPTIAGDLHLTEQGVRHLLSSVYRKIGTDESGLAAALKSFPCPRS